MIVFSRLLLRLAASGIHVQHAFQKLLNIPPEDFRWYAAFHDEGGHPHVHMMAWSKKPGQSYLNRDGIRKIKSVLTNQIFQQELLHIYEDKSQSSDELVRETRSAMLALVQKMQNSACEHPEAEQMIWELARELGSRALIPSQKCGSPDPTFPPIRPYPRGHCSGC